MRRIRLQELFEKFLGEKMTPQEIRQLQELIQDERNTEVLDNLLKTAYSNTSLSVKGDYDLDEMLKELKSKAGYEEKTTGRTTRMNRLNRTGWWMVAASVVIVSGISAYFLLFSRPQQQVIAVKPQNLTDTILPGSNKAVLTLANGSTILLDDAQKGILAKQGNTEIIKSDNGKLAYHSESTAGIEIVYNTLTTPRGGQYEIILPDGTKAWLNAQTSLKFPTVFSGKAREVELTGEAYFEVTKNKNAPFVVLSKQTRVTVLGTHFNINSYSDEKNTLTTLLEGSVKVSSDAGDELLQPGQQAVYSTETNALSVRKVKAKQAIGWKNGVFEFDDTDLSAILRQISRWYDVDIVYVPHGEEIKFGGVISRSLNLTDILRLLETNEVHFKVEGRKIIVNP